MASGTVKWFNMQKGYGFIGSDDGGPDVFAHISVVPEAGLPELREASERTCKPRVVCFSPLCQTGPRQINDCDPPNNAAEEGVRHPYCPSRNPHSDTRHHQYSYCAPHGEPPDLAPLIST